MMDYLKKRLIANEEAPMKVKDVMHKGSTWVQSDTPVRDIAKLMRKEDVGAIPVRADGQLVGIVTDRDITCRALANSGDINRMTAKDVMTKKVICCSPNDNVSAAVKKIEQKKIRRLPVTDGRAGLVGMLSLGDVSHKISKQLSGEMLRAVSAHHR